MARFGSLNRARQKAHYNTLAQTKSLVIVHPPDFVPALAQEEDRANARQRVAGLKNNENGLRDLPGPGLTSGVYPACRRGRVPPTGGHHATDSTLQHCPQAKSRDNQH